MYTGYGRQPMVMYRPGRSRAKKLPKNFKAMKSFYTGEIGKAIRSYPQNKYYYTATERGKDYDGNVYDTAADFGPSYSGASVAQRALRKTRRVFGRGLYWGDVGRNIGRFAGGFFGPLASAAGGYLGNMAGNYLNPHLKSLTGRGAYGGSMGMSSGEAGVVTNDLMSIPGTGPNLVTFGNGAGQTICISHREFVGNVYAPPSAAFLNQQFRINPGLYETFPWLSQIAQNFDEYTLVQCAFQFRSLVTDFASNSGQVGTIILATQYNNNDSPFTGSRQMLNYDGAMSCKTSQTDFQGVECDPSKLSMGVGKYVRTTTVTTSQDINTLDSGIFNLAIEGVPATYFNEKMGELWVSYTVHLRKPKEFASIGYGIDSDLFVLPRSAAATDAGGPVSTATALALTNALLSGQTNSVGSSLSIDADVTGRLVLQLNLPSTVTGDYELSISVNSTTVTTVQSAVPNALALDVTTGTAVASGQAFSNCARAQSGTLPPSVWAPGSVPVSQVTVASPTTFFASLTGAVTPVNDILVPTLSSSGPGAVGPLPPFGPAVPNVAAWTWFNQSAASPLQLPDLNGAIFPGVPPLVEASMTVTDQLVMNSVWSGTSSLSTFVAHIHVAEGSTNQVRITLVQSSSDPTATLGLQVGLKQYNTIGEADNGTPILINKSGAVVSYP